MFILSEMGRKSIANIAKIVSASDQSTLNRAFHSVDPDLLKKIYSIH